MSSSIWSWVLCRVTSMAPSTCSCAVHPLLFAEDDVFSPVWISDFFCRGWEVLAHTDKHHGNQEKLNTQVYLFKRRILYLVSSQDAGKGCSLQLGDPFISAGPDFTRIPQNTVCLSETHLLPSLGHCFSVHKIHLYGSYHMCFTTACVTSPLSQGQAHPDPHRLAPQPSP